MQFQVPPEAWGQRLRLFMRDALPLEPEDFADHLIASGKVRVDGELARSKRTLRKGETVTVQDYSHERAAFSSESIPVTVLYEDKNIIVLDKPAGCTVVRERRRAACPFQNGLFEHIKKSLQASGAAPRLRGRGYRPRAVHRLDRDTTGIVIFAASRAGELHMARLFRDNAVAKEYLVVLCGEVLRDAGKIEGAIAAAPRDVSRMVIDERTGKPALTRYEVSERFRGYTLASVRTDTGRRHQIRIHFAHIGHPVVADRVYGGGNALFLSSIKPGYRPKRNAREKPLIARPALHAQSVTFVPPDAECHISIQSRIPGDIDLLLKMLRKYAVRAE